MPADWLVGCLHDLPEESRTPWHVDVVNLREVGPGLRASGRTGGYPVEHFERLYALSRDVSDQISGLSKPAQDLQG